MDFTTLTSQILAAMTVISTLTSLFITWINIKPSVKKANIENERLENSVGIEAVERLNTVGLTLIGTLEKQIKTCEERKADLETLTQGLSLETTDLKIRVKKLALSLRRIIERHDTIAKEYGQHNCPGIPIINKMLLDIIDEIEKEVDV